jgi:purine-binding chemotaxis protein CheW
VDVVVFELDQRQYALELSAVQRVLSLGPVVPVPTAPQVIAGAVNVRGRVVPVIDLGMILHQQRDRPRREQNGVLVGAAGRQLLICVDRIGQATSASRVAAPLGGPGELFSAGAVELAEGAVPLLDVDRLFAELAARIDGHLSVPTAAPEDEGSSQRRGTPR